MGFDCAMETKDRKYANAADRKLAILVGFLLDSRSAVKTMRIPEKKCHINSHVCRYPPRVALPCETWQNALDGASWRNCGRGASWRPSWASWAHISKAAASSLRPAPNLGAIIAENA